MRYKFGGLIHGGAYFWNFTVCALYSLQDLLYERGIKMESSRKLSNFNFQGTNTFDQNILSHIAFFCILFKSYRYN